MARKRPRIYPRTLRNGEVRYDVSFDFEDAQGRRKQQMRTFRTEKDARLALAEHETRRGHGQTLLLKQATFAECAADWLGAHRTYIRPGTAHTYQTLLKNHILPELGHLPTGKITIARLQLHYRTLGSRGVGAGLVRNVHQRCVQILRWAALHDYAVDASALQTRTPRYTPRQMTCWSDEQMARFLEVADSSEFGLLWRTALMTGMRRGELMGLRWHDIDWDGSAIHVCQARTRVAGRIVVGGTKNGSTRVVSIQPQLLARLREHRNSQLQRRLHLGAVWQEPDLVFTNERGHTLQPDRLRRSLESLVARAGLAPIRIHDLRHSHASFLFRHGKSAPEVAERLGHKNVAQTLNVYAHCIAAQHRATAELLGQMFG